MPSVVFIRMGSAASSSQNLLLQYAPAIVTAIAAIIGIIVQVVVARQSLAAQREFEVERARQQALMAFYNPLDVCLTQLESMLRESGFEISSYDPAKPLLRRALRNIAICCESIEQVYSSQFASFAPLDGASIADLATLRTWCSCVLRFNEGVELGVGVMPLDLTVLDLIANIHQAIEHERTWLEGRRRQTHLRESMKA